MKILYITDIDLSFKDAPPIHVKQISEIMGEKNEVILLAPKKNFLQKLKLIL